jgi:hypothetical protein
MTKLLADVRDSIKAGGHKERTKRFPSGTRPDPSSPIHDGKPPAQHREEAQSLRAENSEHVPARSLPIAGVLAPPSGGRCIVGPAAMLPSAKCKISSGGWGMTAKAWCAISKAVEMVATTQGASQERAQAWLIQTCASGNVRARVSSSANRETQLADDGSMEIDMRSRSELLLAVGPVSPNIPGARRKTCFACTGLQVRSPPI